MQDGTYTSNPKSHITTINTIQIIVVVIAIVMAITTIIIFERRSHST